MAKTYLIKEIFYTLQGEGYHTGKAAVFVRFGGCNLWSGKEEDRQKDFDRIGASCALWCDTDFKNGTKLTAIEILDKVKSVGGKCKFVVLTGGEPGLQYDNELDEAFQRENFYIAVETNGTVKLKCRPEWVCISPKQINEKWIYFDCDEIKVVVPAYDQQKVMDKYFFEAEHPGDAIITKHRLGITPLGTSYRIPNAGTHPSKEAPKFYIQPEDGPNLKANTEKCLQIVKSDPRWKLSLQVHKILNIP